MKPPISSVIQTPAVLALLQRAGGQIRFYPFGSAPQHPQGPDYPYAVWQTAYGSPENYLDQVPDVDGWGTQIDIYDAPESNGSRVEAVAKALRDAIEPVAYITSWRGEDRDPVTKAYRYGFDADWLTPR